MFVSSGAGDTEAAWRQAAKVMADVGLPLHEVEDGQSFVEPPGLELVRINLRAGLARGRRCRFGLGAQALLRRRRVAGREVENLIGHFTHAMLLNRPALCVFRAACDYARKHCRNLAPLWASVRQELTTTMHLLSLLAVQFDLPLSGRVTCSGATPRGFMQCRWQTWSPWSYAR
ncbi:unnamed protein product [Prorocentrum cordatum]|uniref:Uncharacterized protein n=1 Tax=Prorocentrum cordatum TaxID=2364126 RepID=A0ABN9U0B8_9DINO|nr:unnamed protein product [Polarella glacialis]